MAINANYPIKVMYSVVDPAGEYVYLALDTGWNNFDGNDYSRFIAQENCAFFRVKISDNSYSCVMQGLFVQSMDDQYRQNISGNQKPIQFYAASNVYFSGTELTREQNSYPDCCDADGNEFTVTEYWIGPTDWRAQIYRVSAATEKSQNLVRIMVSSRSAHSLLPMSPCVIGPVTPCACSWVFQSLWPWTT